MFIGHYAVGFASKRFAPRAPLGVLIAAPILLDILFPVFLLAGWESARFVPAATPFLRISLDDYPWSHSLLAAALWGLLFALAYWALRRDRRGAFVIWIGVVSHWVLDFISHRPDMPLAPGTAARVGLDLWSSTIGTVVVEGLLFVAGIWLYVRTTRAKDRQGRWALWSLVGFLALMYVADIFSSAPPDIKGFAWVALPLTALLLAWACWADRHRQVKT
jgi:hypothetical protein